VEQGQDLQGGSQVLKSEGTWLSYGKDWEGPRSCPLSACELEGTEIIYLARRSSASDGSARNGAGKIRKEKKRKLQGGGEVTEREPKQFGMPFRR